MPCWVTKLAPGFNFSETVMRTFQNAFVFYLRNKGLEPFWASRLEVIIHEMAPPCPVQEEESK